MDPFPNVYSRLVDAKSYQFESFAHGVPVRIHKHLDEEAIGIQQALDDWRKHVDPTTTRSISMGTLGGMVALGAPECLPDRVRTLSYAVEFALLQDAASDLPDVSQADAEEGRCSPVNMHHSGKNKMLAKVVSQMMQADPVRAPGVLEEWLNMSKRAAGFRSNNTFEDFQQYLDYRVEDYGIGFCSNLIRFGMGLTIPESEKYRKDLVRSAYSAAALVNDLFSVEREHKESLESGSPMSANGVAVLMQKNRITMHEAIELCKERISVEVQNYLAVLESSKANRSLSPDLLRYLEATLYFLGGNYLWHQTNARYHSDD